LSMLDDDVEIAQKSGVDSRSLLNVSFLALRFINFCLFNSFMSTPIEASMASLYYSMALIS